MTPPEDSSGPNRRAFVQRIVGVGAAVASANLLAGCASASAAPVYGSASRQQPWDMSWVDKLGTFRTAYDSPEVLGGAALSYAEAAFAGYKATGGRDGDFTPVLILRHRASIMVLNDDMWKRLTLGAEYKIDDPRSGAPAMRNPFIDVRASDTDSVGVTAALDALIRRGAVALACNYALTGVASRLKAREPDRKYTTESALEEVHRNVLPGCYVMPNGIFAVSAAQDAGCHYMRVLV